METMFETAASKAAQAVVDEARMELEHTKGCLKASEDDLNSLRKNSRNRSEYERRVRMYTDSVALKEKILNEALVLQGNANEVFDINKQIEDLVYQRNAMCGSQLILSHFQVALRKFK